MLKPTSIATDEYGIIQLFSVDAERMLGYPASDVVNKMAPADITNADEWSYSLTT